MNSPSCTITVALSPVLLLAPQKTETQGHLVKPLRPLKCVSVPVSPKSSHVEWTGRHQKLGSLLCQQRGWESGEVSGFWSWPVTLAVLWVIHSNLLLAQARPPRSWQLQPGVSGDDSTWLGNFSVFCFLFFFLIKNEIWTTVLKQPSFSNHTFYYVGI